MLKLLTFHSPVYYSATWIACGLFQSVAWPAEVSFSKLLGNFASNVFEFILEKVLLIKLM